MASSIIIHTLNIYPTMNSATSRRAGAKLISSLTSSPQRCRTPRHHVRTRIIQVQATKSFTSLPRLHQQQQPASTTPSSTPLQPSTDTTPSAKTPPTAEPHNLTPSSSPSALHNLDPATTPLETSDTTEDWTRSYHGLSSTPFTPDQSAILMQPIPTSDIEIKPDGIIYLPEIKYRRILNRAFGPGGWGLAPRSETIVTPKLVTREYGLICGGRLVSIARGEQQYFDPEGVPTATEGCKSNALMRCCKDLGVASELWDPRFVRKFLAEEGREVVVEHQVTRKRRRHWMRADDVVRYPFKEVPGAVGGTGNQAGKK